MADRMAEQIGNYRIVRLIDRGGFAHVYLGEHIYLGTQVAIKILDTRLTIDDRDSFLTKVSQRDEASSKHRYCICEANSLSTGVRPQPPLDSQRH